MMDGVSIIALESLRMKVKSTRGRHAGQLGKAHQGIHKEITDWWQKLDPAEQKTYLAQGTTPELLEEWRHYGLATVGNFPKEVQYAAFNLGKLVREYKRILGEKRCNLKANRRGVEIPKPFLPGELFQKGDSGSEQDAELKFNKDELRMLGDSAHDVIWVMQHLGYIDAFRLLSYLIQAAAKNDTNFFKEFCRRVCCGVPLESPAEPLISAMVSLKRCYEKEQWNKGPGVLYEREIPSLVPVLKLPIGQRPPLKLAQIADYVRVFGKISVSERALSRYAKVFGIPIAPRGRRKSGT